MAAPRRPRAVSAARVRSLRARLLAWWDAGHRDLPWRARAGEPPEPYRVWISEVMLQQTRVDAVIPYYARFLARFPTLAALAAAPEEDVLAAWSGLGYYARARNLHRAAREALARHGALPADLVALRALPGFGAYTSAAVASLAFALPAAAVDGNVARVLARVFLVKDPPARAAPRIAALADALLARERAGDWNQALMDLGATLCTKPAPACARCPLFTLCEARRAGRAREVPPARARRAPRALSVACAVVRDGDALLLARREGRGLFGGLWELPSAELREGDEARATLRVALAARGLAIEPGRELARVTRALTHRSLSLVAYACTLAGAVPPGARWVAPDAISTIGLSTAVRCVVEALPPSPHAASGDRAGRPRASTRAAAGKKALTREGRTV